VRYYASMLRRWQLIRILVRTNHPCLRVGHHNVLFTLMLPSTTLYCHKFRGMVDALVDLVLPIDRILVLNILCGLNKRFEHLRAIIQRSSPFSNFLKVHDDLLLEEIHLDTAGSSAAPTTLYTSTAPPAPKP
jgi:hypothetical protein